MASPFLGDLNDFIQPSQACIKPVPSKDETRSKVAKTDEDFAVTLDLTDDKAVSNDPVTISLNDCLACSGCITSAESVLVAQQTYLQLNSALEVNKEAEIAGLAKPKLVVVSISPQSRAALAVRYGISQELCMQKLRAFLRSLGVDFVFDTVLARDICLYECCREFMDTGEDRKLPLITSACPGWICYAEKTQAQMIEMLSTVKSPQQIMGTLVKHFFPRTLKNRAWNPSNVFHVTVMPCYDKKLEASRDDFVGEVSGARDVDCVIATSELLQMIKEKFGEDEQGFLAIEPVDELIIDEPFSMIDSNGQLLSHSGSGSGGYLENVMRFAAKKLFNIDLIMENNELLVSPGNPATLTIQSQRNLDYQDYTLTDQQGTALLRFCKVYGFRNVQTLVRKLKTKRVTYDYIEVMACPGACLNGGGQPRPDSTKMTPQQNLKEMDRIYREQRLIEPLVNEKAEKIYREWIGGHGSPLLRTTFKAVTDSTGSNRSNFSVQW